jgi:hypothetical protein
MNHVTRGRTSPALIVAILALVAAVAGTAVAGPGAVSSKITKKKVTKIADKEINQLASGLNVNSAKTADSAKSAANVLAAEVANGCGQVTGGTGGITVAAAGTECNVTFPRSISDCAITLGTLFDFPGGGETTYRKSSSTVVQVSRRDSAGGTPTAGAFSIAATCPA